MLKEGSVLHETEFKGTLRFIKYEDIPRVLPIITAWVRDSEKHQIIDREVKLVLDAISESLNAEDGKVYLVAERDGKLVGMMGLRPPEDKILVYTQTQKPIELVNAFVDPKLQGQHQHAGTALVSGLTQVAKTLGCSEIVLSSGKRYEKTGWPFWKKLFGSEIDTVPGWFGKGTIAKIWRKEISR